jgi:hypothetical protein
MGDSKILKKFRRLCDDYKVEFVIEGVVEDFDTVYPVPPERLTRGMAINIGEETRLVVFHNTKRPPVEIGDRVIVVGKEYPTKKAGILPVTILNPTKKWVLFSREYLLKKPDKSELAITLIGSGIFIVAWLIARDSFPAFAFGILLPFLLFFPPPYLMTFLRRPRLHNCSKQECQLLLEEIGGRFAPRVKATERQTRRTFQG